MYINMLKCCWFSLKMILFISIHFSFLSKAYKWLLYKDFICTIVHFIERFYLWLIFVSCTCNCFEHLYNNPYKIKSTCVSFFLILIESSPHLLTTKLDWGIKDASISVLGCTLWLWFWAESLSIDLYLICIQENTCTKVWNKQLQASHRPIIAVRSHIPRALDSQIVAMVTTTQDRKWGMMNWPLQMIASVSITDTGITKDSL